MSKFAKPLFLILLVLALSTVGLAQSQAGSGQIAGQVADTNGAAVPNATVKVTNKGTGLERTATTSADGLFTIVLLLPAPTRLSPRLVALRWLLLMTLR